MTNDNKTGVLKPYVVLAYNRRAANLFMFFVLGYRMKFVALHIIYLERTMIEVMESALQKAAGEEWMNSSKCLPINIRR